MSNMLRALRKPAEALHVLTVGDVQVGDLIFYEAINSELAATSPPGTGRVHHVEICTVAAQVPVAPQPAAAQLAIVPHATITGQVNLQANPERRFAALQHTRSTPLTPKKEDRLIVLRCTSQALRQRAAAYAVRWCRLVIPFSRRRTEPDTTDKDVPKHRALFTASGRFRAIRYTARRSGDPQEAADDPKPTKGMFCSHFVIACYQVAGLEQFVRAAGRGVRVQDKKGSYQLNQIPQQYRAVVPGYENYRQSDDANPNQAGQAGITFWDFAQAGDINAFPWAQHITAGMQVDCKKAHPSALLACLLADKNGWELCGVIKPSAE